MFGLGVMELLVVLALVIFVFGWGRLPQLGSNFRKAIRNFKRMSQGEDEIDVTPTVPEDADGKESHHARHRDG
ncbi:MAG: twin-arginine translocase TatA/TatE family subunit [Nitrospinae bacterium]|nr:twin-arginine translocase TatA/TatE family subunit [Nitrospinota bacterium]